MDACFVMDNPDCPNPHFELDIYIHMIDTRVLHTETVPTVNSLQLWEVKTRGNRPKTSLLQREPHISVNKVLPCGARFDGVDFSGQVG